MLPSDLQARELCAEVRFLISGLTPRSAWLAHSSWTVICRARPPGAPSPHGWAGPSALPSPAPLSWVSSGHISSWEVQHLEVPSQRVSTGKEHSFYRFQTLMGQLGTSACSSPQALVLTINQTRGCGAWLEFLNLRHDVAGPELFWARPANSV